MSLLVIEGTWEEIKRREAALIGRHLRLTVEPERPAICKETIQPGESAAAAVPNVLRGMGAFKGKTGGSEALAQEKRAEIEREERRF